MALRQKDKVTLHVAEPWGFAGHDNRPFKATVVKVSRDMERAIIRLDRPPTHMERVWEYLLLMSRYVGASLLDFGHLWRRKLVVNVIWFDPGVALSEDPFSDSMIRAHTTMDGTVAIGHIERRGI